MSALKYWVWLSELNGLGNQTRLTLLRRFGTPEEVFYADTEEILLTEGITRQQAKLLENHELVEADRILADCQRLDIRLMTILDGDYPGRLQNIYDPPCLLYVKGRMPVFDEEAAVAVVGTRSCTPYGETQAEKLGCGLASAGAVVISGLARGIDAAATRGALNAGGTAVGVVGNGLDVFYPKDSRYLYEELAVKGALISEYPPGAEPAKPHFPARNRIISGLSVATLVVEAPERSGALITAGLALEQGRDIYAVPGPIDAPASAGCNRLIREGAGLVAEPWDLLMDYTEQFPGKLRQERSHRQPLLTGPWKSQPEQREDRQRQEEEALPQLSLSHNELGLTDDQIRLLRTLGSEPIYVDDLIEQTELPTRRVLSALTILEIENLVQQHSGKRYTLAVTLSE